MKNNTALNRKIYYRRNLPHYHPPEVTFFITFRLVNSLPRKFIEELKEEYEFQKKVLSKNKFVKLKEKNLYVHSKRYFSKFDRLLDGSTSGSLWLKDERVAQIVTTAIHDKDGEEYDLLSFCIMPNHVHIVFTPITRDSSRDARLESQVTEILRKLKGATAYEANKILNRSGQFWHRESYDHVVRNETELERIINYVLNNPVKSGLVDKWVEWKWSYCNSRFISSYSI